MKTQNSTTSVRSPSPPTQPDQPAPNSFANVLSAIQQLPGGAQTSAPQTTQAQAGGGVRTGERSLRLAGAETTWPGQGEANSSLSKSLGFGKLSKNTRNELLAAVGQHANDPVFAERLEKLVGDKNFQALSPVEQGRAIGAINQFALSDAYQGGSGWFSSKVNDKDRANMLGNVATTVTSGGYQGMQPGGRSAMENAVQAHASDSSYIAKLTNFANDPGVAAMKNGEAQGALIESYGNDPYFEMGVDASRSSDRYEALKAEGRAEVLTDLAKFGQSPSYRTSGNSKGAATMIFGDVAAFSAAHPDNKVVRNSLDSVLDGRTKLKAFDQAPNSTGDLHGDAADNGEIRLNINPDSRVRFPETFVHETNHVKNPGAKMGAADQFLNEYRAWCVGQEAYYGKLTAAQQARIVNTLTGSGSPYTVLQKLYQSNPKFNAVVNWLKNELTGPDAKPVDPEVLRNYMRGHGLWSEYMNRESNMDNH